MRSAAANLAEVVAAALLVGLCLVVLIGVVSRAFGRPVSWSEEVARYLYVWLTFVGAAVAAKRGANFSLNLVASRLGPRWARAMAALADLGTAAFGVALVVYSGPLIDLAAHQRGAAVAIPLSWVFAALPTGGLLMAVFALVHLWHVRQQPVVRAIPAVDEAAVAN